MGWILSTTYKRTDLAAIKDFASYPGAPLPRAGLVDRPLAAGHRLAFWSAGGAVW